MDVNKFPDGFKTIVETISANGPIALLVLLLFILLGGVYLFRQSILQSRIARICFAGLAVIFGGLLVFLVYQISNCYLTNACREPLVVIKGTIRHPPPDRDGSNLVFSLVSPNTQGVGDTENRFYSYDKNFEERRIIGIAKPDRIELTIANRPLFRACSEDSAGAGLRNKNNITSYVIHLPANAYAKGSDGGKGYIIYQLEFDYLTKKEHDVLRVSGFSGIDPGKLQILVRHSPDGQCLDRPESEYVDIVMPPKDTASLPLPMSARDVVELLGDALIATGHAQEKSATEKNAADKKAIDLLGVADPSLAGKARDVISQAPAEFRSEIEGVLRSTDNASAARQADLLIALKGAQKPSTLPPQTIQDILRLSYAPSPDLRLAARNYLADPAILNDDVVKPASAYYAKHRDELKARDVESFLLLALTMREIYYVAGVNKIVDYTGNWGERDRDPAAIDASLAYFDLGIAMIKDVPASNAVPYAKSYYGRSLALRSRVTINAALAKLGAGATSKDINGQIYALAKQSAPLPLTDPERGQFIGTLDAFLTLVNGREKEYFWPAHIEKMKGCRRAQTYDCIR